MIRMPRISFVMPQRNRGNIIEKSIRSIINQTEKDWELIIVDDHSQKDDKVEEVVRIFNDERIKLIRMPYNCPWGIPSARNFGNMYANSPIIAVADSDDINKPRRCEITLDHFHKDRCDVFFGRYDIYRIEHEELVEPDFQLSTFNYHSLDNRNPIPHGSSAYTREIAHRFPYNSFFGRGEDYDFFMRLIKEKKRFSYSTETIFTYVKHPGNVTKGGGMDTVDRIIKLNYGIKEVDRSTAVNDYVENVYQRVPEL
jgi:glycosyltransferase involved in cell wall biosynthesis